MCIDETVLGASNEEADKEALYNEWISMASAQQQDEGGASAATVIHGSVSPAKKGGGAPQVTIFNDCEKSHKHDVQDALLNHTHEQCATCCCQGSEKVLQEFEAYYSEGGKSNSRNNKKGSVIE